MIGSFVHAGMFLFSASGGDFLFSVIEYFFSGKELCQNSRDNIIGTFIHFNMSKFTFNK